jgi:hypothetical protein
MYKIFFLLPSRIPFLKHGEGNDPAKVAANATALLTRYGYTAEELAALAEADETKIGDLFTARFTNIETDVIARKGKPLQEAARIGALKDAHHTTEKRVLETLKELGIEFGEEEVKALDEKGRIEALVKLGLERKKVATDPNAPEDVKALQVRLEAERKGAIEAQKKAVQLEKQLKELNESLPGLEDKIEMRYFAEQNWQQLATKAETLEMLTVKDANFLLPYIKGQMMGKGHAFVAEKGTSGKTLLVVDSEGQPIPIDGGAGNHTPETYIAALYAPLFKKSNADPGGTGIPGLPKFEPAQPLTGNAKKAHDAMMAQANSVK